MKNKLKQILHSVFPIFTFQFKELWDIFKNSKIGQYILIWLMGLFAIFIGIFAILAVFSFVVWDVPNLRMPLEGFESGVVRLLLIAYSFFILTATGD